MKANLILILVTIGGFVLLLGSTAALGVGIKIRYDNLQNPASALGNNGGTLKTGCGLADVSRWANFINEAALQFNLEPHVIAAVIHQESQGKERAESEIYDEHGNKIPGAKGLMQIMPDTWPGIRAKGNSVAVNAKDPSQRATALTNRAGEALPDDWFNPESNIYAGSFYLRQMHNDFRSTRLMLAAYNSGPGNVQKYGGVPPIEQTQTYVSNILLKWIPQYKKCLEKTTSSSGGTVSSDIGEVSRAVKAVLDYAKANPDVVCQRTNGTGSQGCAETAARTLGNTFNTNGKEGIFLGKYPKRNRTDPPTPTDLDQARKILDANDIPVWHINGEFSGQHWIIILKIDKDNEIYYLDPAAIGGGLSGGKVLHKPFNAQSNVSDGGRVAYFGITPRGSKDGDDYYERGYRFPASKYLK